MDAVVCFMENYPEHLRGRRFILYTDHKPIESLSTLNTKTMIRLQLAMMDFNFEIRYKKKGKCQLISYAEALWRWAQYQNPI
jgi:hypothetical protein